MKSSRLLFTVLCVLCLSVLQADARFKDMASSGSCPGGGNWITHVYVDENSGHVVGSSGVGCDGKFWSHAGLVGGSVSGHITSNNQWMNEITVTSDFEATYKILDLQTGNWVGASVGPIPANTPTSISVTGLVGPYMLVAEDATGQWPDYRMLNF